MMFNPSSLIFHLRQWPKCFLSLPFNCVFCTLGFMMYTFGTIKYIFDLGYDEGVKFVLI